MSLFGIDNCCRNSAISLVSSEGKSVNVNKYFLFIYNEFYKNLLTELKSNDVTIIFDDWSFNDLLMFQRVVTEKHFKCISTLENHEEQNTNKTDIETKKERSEYIEYDDIETENERSDSGDEGNIVEATKETLTEESKEAVTLMEDSKTLYEIKCPFNCAKASDSWTEDTLFAHIYIDHCKEVGNNYQLSVERFIKNLNQKISLKCAFSSECNFTPNKESKMYTKEKGIHSLKNHYQQVHLDDPSTCDNCGKEYKNGKYLKSHLQKGVCLQENEQCQDCGKNFNSRYNLERHIRQKHYKNQQKQCTKCGKTFYDSSSLKSHIRIIHEKLKNCICDMCGKNIGAFYNLNNHRLNMHGARFPSIKDYRSLISSGKHPFITNVKEALQAKLW